MSPKHKRELITNDEGLSMALVDIERGNGNFLYLALLKERIGCFPPSSYFQAEDLEFKNVEYIVIFQRLWTLNHIVRYLTQQ